MNLDAEEPSLRPSRVPESEEPSAVAEIQADVVKSDADVVAVTDFETEPAAENQSTVTEDDDAFVCTGECTGECEGPGEGLANGSGYRGERNA